mmetsp:Transcript_17234/g.23710  ORF Transcript_17234/g.23710 Transcript_17234/m.23710 type:complete len:440 (-) Transcript_17234:226-1545(-)|eukprot:CAMPEP_0185729510 /NCGR_PEP_ID=MMETSP1171-20130828/6293_1 /TAXON_ID=374046 /ORGANISM="Helicotheca tamensis, Strain CCMP826" /LENGTH=439 /DNA_ID=CAMNT_0028398375 /DNA_START=65 /DNA_END=1384 /DNA_ORIENTATION=-
MSATTPRVAVVGGGIAGTFASLVLRNRGLNPLLIDQGKKAVGGRLRGADRSILGVDAGAQFFRASDPRLGHVLQMLEGAGLLKRWEGKFGLLGSRGGGFLPSSIVGSAASSPRNMGRQGGEEEMLAGEETFHATDCGDFCGFVSHHRPDSIPTYVASSNNSDLCPNICRMAGIESVMDARVMKAETVDGGGWTLEAENGSINYDLLRNEVFDALVLTTHDPSLASKTVFSIAQAEAQAKAVSSTPSDSVADTVQARLGNLAKDLQSLRDNSRQPLFTWSGRFSSSCMPFDAASVPGSHTVQFLARESSKPDRNCSTDGEVWTAMSTSAFANEIIKRHGKTRKASEEASNMLSEEVATLLASTTGEAKETPVDASAVRWASAFTSKTLALKEDSIILHPWRLAIGGEFIREMDAYETPFEAAALSGLEAGDRVAALFQER